VAARRARFPPGVAKLKLGGESPAHNGLKASRAARYARVLASRIGIGHPGNKDLVAGYVLTPPPAVERD